MTDAPAKPRPSDRHKSAKPEQWSSPSIAQITQDGAVIGCSCGWTGHHRRTVIREDKAERHVNKRHGGQAMWL